MSLASLRLSRLNRLLLVAIAGVFLNCCSAHQSASLRTGASERPARRVILSIDGLRPDFFDADRFRMPQLRKIAREGYRIQRVAPEFPSLTYPMHASLVTGASAVEHGISSNIRWRTAYNPSPRWFWDAKDFRVPPLWSLAKSRGLKVAILRWPSSDGADVDWLIPEVFKTPGIRPLEDWKLALSHMDQKFAAQLAAATGVSEIKSVSELDQWTAQALHYLLRKSEAQLIFTHWISADLIQHQKGRDSPDLNAALESLDAELGRLVKELDPTRDQLFVVGDHGMADVGRMIHPNVWLAEKGWFGTKSGQVIAHAEGGSAGIYIRGSGPDPQRILEYLASRCATRCRVLDRAELDRRGALPEAVGALVAQPGYAFGPRSTGTDLESLGKTEGQHGYLGDLPDMETSFVAWGRGWQRRKHVPWGEWRAVSRILRDSLE